MIIGLDSWRLDEAPDSSHQVTLNTFLLVRSLQLLDASAPLIIRDTGTTDTLLSVSHARININIADLDPQRTVGWIVEPAVDLPAQKEEDQQRTSEIQLEKRLGIQFSAADWIQCDVELSHEGNDVDQQAHIRAVHAERGLEWEFVQRMTVVSPIRSQSLRNGF